MITPRTEAELSDAISGAKGPLRIIGGGTRPIGNPVTGEVLSTSALTGVEIYEPGALTLVVKAGTPLAEVEATLAAENQRLPFEPMDHRAVMGSQGEPTIGGVVAANVSGPRRIQAGACRDSLIGVRFVDGQGAVLKNGGRVMKNVTGYDLVKLMAGSYGTLGVLSEVSFKLLPGVATTAALVLKGLDVSRAVGAMSKALGSPYEVSGAAHDPEAERTTLRLEGFEASVRYRAEQLRTLLSEFGEAEIIDEGAVALWSDIRDVRDLAGEQGDLWRISVKPSDGPAVAAALPDARLRMDWGGGLVWALCAEGRDLRPALSEISGHATLLRAGHDTRAAIGAFPPEPAPVAAVSKGLREKFDPRGILNPGLMG
ncbi:MAG: glycolate oxidase subunit GlcE [Litoreibacter sp.]|nr:glycolate oxidase subunit GlcE [Litoreibacter sp.]